MGTGVEVVDLDTRFATLARPWEPWTVAMVNDYDLRVVKVEGAFTPHAHPDTDELFLVLRGCLLIRFEQGETWLGPGRLCVVPRGVTHCPEAAEETQVLLFEPSPTVNTGDNPGRFTAARRSE